MTAFSLELSDGLHELAVDLDQFVHGGIIMDGDTVAGMVIQLRRLHRRARSLENEVSAKRWNDAARQDRIRDTDAILAEVQRPDTNVTLFPVIPRPFSDGHPRGAA